MYAVTYQAEDLNLIPALRHGQVFFNGDIDLNADTDGSWEVARIWVATRTPPPQGVRYLHGMEPLALDHPVYALVVKAIAEHDKATQAVTNCVLDDLAGANRAAYEDHQYQLGKDIARGLEVR